MENSTKLNCYQVHLEHPNSDETTVVWAASERFARSIAEADATEPGSRAVWVAPLH